MTTTQACRLFASPEGVDDPGPVIRQRGQYVMLDHEDRDLLSPKQG